MADKEPPFTIRYIGVRPQSLDAHELIQTLSALTRISMKACQTTYGAETRASFRIIHVQSGTISIEGFIELIAGLQPAFALMPLLSFGVRDVPELIKRWFDLLKFLKGEPAKVIQHVDNGNAVQIESASGEIQIVNGNVYNTFIFNNVGRDAAKLDVPTKRGAKQMELYRGKRRIGTYSVDDLSSFRPIKPADTPLESEIKAIVEIIAPVFEGEGVWRFKLGRMTLTAKLLDQDYRQRVSGGEESFRHGDLLDVQLKTVQERAGNKISTKHFITRVNGRA